MSVDLDVLLEQARVRLDTREGQGTVTTMRPRTWPVALAAWAAPA
ncbi:hypothetical protein AB0C38_48840 [Amycolatopsis sp. NPDC048633]